MTTLNEEYMATITMDATEIERRRAQSYLGSYNNQILDQSNYVAWLESTLTTARETIVTMQATIDDLNAQILVLQGG
jgi:hypothetical protein